MMRIIAGTFKGNKVYCPRNNKIRPISARARKMIFDILYKEIEGAKILDLFCGTGILSIEAMSRGALSAALVDKSINVARHNLTEFKLFDAVSLHKSSVDNFLKKNIKKKYFFDIIFFDPPWTEKIMKILKFIDFFDILSEKGLMILKMPQKSDMILDFEKICEIDSRRVGNAKIHFLRRRSNV